MHIVILWSIMILGIKNLTIEGRKYKWQDLLYQETFIMEKIL